MGDKVEVTAADVAEITENDGSVKTVVGLANINETIKDAPAGTKVRIVKAAQGSKITAPGGSYCRKYYGREHRGERGYVRCGSDDYSREET